MSDVTYVVHPGHVRSRHDGDLHFVGTMQLVRLYGIPPRARWVQYPQSEFAMHGWRDPPNAVHLHPRDDGNYTLR